MMVILLAVVTVPVAGSARMLQSELTLTVDPSSVVIKVGDTARVNVTLRDVMLNPGKVCFGVEGFPSSGFIESFDPTCVDPKPDGETTTRMSVEATPAAAPQNFTASVVAIGPNWTARSPISITVEPAMSAWIPWSIIFVFVLILIIPLLVRTRKTNSAGHRKRSGR